MTGAPRLIGLKSVAAVALSAPLVALAAWRHALDPSTLRHQSPGACFLAGLVAGLAVALLGVGWRFELRSRSALAVVRGRPRRVERLAEGARPRELPAMVQRALLLVGFAGVAIPGLGNHAAARIAQLPGELAAPAPSEYCMPAPATPGAPAGPAAPPSPVDQPGCALVLRAYQLGYAKTLGACAPRQAAPTAAPAPAAKREVCTRRQLDEPSLHYGFRRVAAAARAAASVDPAAAADHRVTETRTHLDYLDGLLADIRHAITGSPHAAHHLWVNLPDPHPRSPASWFIGRERCSQQFADLPLWPAWQPGDEARLVEHVLGQLLFATRFGTTASCSDYVVHWDAPPDTCRRLAADPIAALDRDGALTGLRAVLDRRRRQREIGALAQALGRPPPVAPPAAGAIASLACFVVDPAAGPTAGPGRDATGTTISLDGDALSLREIHVPAVRTGGDGPIDVYAALALLLSGPGGDLAAAVRPPEPVEPGGAGGSAPRGISLAGDDFLLTRLDPLIDADPFRGARAPLGRPELIEVYPFEHHLHGFIDGFRRRYLAQRGRL
jgi:hypothetical protein